MAKIHLVRHGEAAAGFGTHKDPGLSELGQKQAESVAHLLATTLVENGPVTVFFQPPCPRLPDRRAACETVAERHSD